MRRLNNTKGYTLLEMIITIGLIAIGLSLTTFGLSVIFSSNVSGYAQKIVSEIKTIQTKEMASKDKDFSLEIRYVTDHYQLYIVENNTAAGTVVATSVDLPKAIIIEKDDNDDGVFEPLNDLRYTDANSRRFIFSDSVGKLISNGQGDYRVSAVNSTREKVFHVYKQNGRVVLD